MNRFSKAGFPILLVLLAAFLVGLQVGVKNDPAERGTGSAIDGTSPGFMAGTWTGIGAQRGESTWTIALIANPEKEYYSIAYPSLSCGGVWVLEEFDATRAWFREQIKYGEDNCYDNSLVAVTSINDRYITLTWFYPDDQLMAWSTVTSMDCKRFRVLMNLLVE